MADLQTLLDEYANSHQNPKNKLIHFICVPIISLTTLTIFWGIHPWLFVGAVVFATIYYLRLSAPLTWGLVPFLLVGTAIFVTHPMGLPLSILLFLLAWAAQFWGHKVEGKKPSFLKDLQFLLVGPLWITANVYEILDLAKR